MDRWQLFLESAISNMGHVAENLVRDLAHDGDTDRFGDRFLNVLATLHEDATVAGRSRAGDTAPRDQDDRRFAETIAASEDHFLAQFLNDLDDGRYRDGSGVLSERSVLARCEMYLTRAKGTANEAWALTDGGPFLWTLHPAEHCEDCPPLADGSPYTLETIPTYPRAGKTECLFNCLCTLSGSTGTTSFD